MNERDALMRAICDNPDDDTPRLVFADWVQEHGDDDRAEFIRLQCQAARLPVVSSARQHKENRINHLLPAHEREWLQALPQTLSCRWGETFSRGFIADLTVLETPTDGVIEGCFDASPVTSLRVNCRPVNWYVLAQTGYLQRLIEITVEQADVDRHALALCKLRPWPQLKRLVIAGTIAEDRQYVPINAATADELFQVYGYRLRLPPRGHRS
ncbi:MAG: TIGR02996 domain-containing protein [Planctomycetes bacterium]|nr:TIGR02996 domain-containing protein [Planctomycetota bacterium]